ncbi:MAG: hypothetical protein ACRC0S_01555 [Fusobacteriaceae bacterium]
MEDKIKNLHKKVYIAMLFQYECFDRLKKWNCIFSIGTLALSIILLSMNEIIKWFEYFGMNGKYLEFIYFVFSLFLVVLSVAWVIITSKYDITLIGIRAEKYKDLHCKIEMSETIEKAKEYFNQYINLKPETNDIFMVNKKKINQRLKENGKNEYLYKI